MLQVSFFYKIVMYCSSIGLPKHSTRLAADPLESEKSLRFYWYFCGGSILSRATQSEAIAH